MNREERIARCEEMLDRAAAAARRMEEAREAFESVRGDLQELEKYYTGPEWKEDFEADEAGLLPAGLKRGVLSEDGISDVLDTFRELRARRVRTSAKALVIRDGRMLAVKLQDADGVFYIMPGGGQHAGELLPAAAEREVAEETGIRVKAGDAVLVIEGAEGEPDHRVDIVFMCEYIGPCDAEQQHDHNQVGIEWLPLETLNKAPLYPSKLRRPIMNLAEGKPAPMYLGNESVGDPEITD